MLSYKKYQAGDKNNKGGDLKGEGQGNRVIQPTDKRSHRGENQADDEIPDRQDGGTHLREGLAIDISFKNRSGESAYDIKEEE